MTEPAHQIKNADIGFWVHSGAKLLGHLHVSKGGVDWYRGKSRLRKYSMTWEQLDRALREHKAPKRPPKAKKKRY